MASRFLRELQDEQRKRTQELVLNLLPVKEDEDNYAIAMDFCTSNLNPKFHSYLDVNPKDVQGLYDSLSGRLEQHLQLAKASRLRHLVARLHSLDLQGAAHDMGSALLGLIFHLGGQPLTTPAVLPASPSPSPSPLHAVRGAGAARTTPALRLHATPGPSPLVTGQGRPTAPSYSGSDAESDTESETESDDDETGSSRLSDWEEDEETASPPPTHPQPSPAAWASPTHGLAPSLPPPASHGGQAGVHAAHGPTAAASHLHAPGPSMYQAMQGDAHEIPLSRTHCPDLVPVHASSLPCDLVPSLTRCRLDGAQFLGPQKALCVSDQHLVQQVCNLLVCGHSTCFTWQPCDSTTAQHGSDLTLTKGSFRPVAGLHTPHLTPSMLSHLLSHFAETGSQLSWMRSLISLAESTPASGPVCAPAPPAAPGQALPPPPPPAALTPTACALLQAVSAQLHRLLQPVISLQQATRFQHLTDGAGAGVAAAAAAGAGQGAAGPSVLQLRLTLDGFTRHVRLLHDTVHGALDAYSTALQQSTELGTEHGEGRGSAAAAKAPLGATAAQPGAHVPPGMTTAAAPGSARAAGLAAGQQRGQVAAAGSSEAAARASCVLLDTLHECVERCGCQGGPQGQAMQQQLLHLLCCALEPTLNSLQAWLFEGTDEHVAGDFFISSTVRLAETDPLFWGHAHTLIRRPAVLTTPSPPGAGAQQQQQGAAVREGSSGAGAQSEVACPRFLQPCVHQLFSAGKALRLLRNGSGSAPSSTGASSLLAAVPGLLLQPAHLPSQSAVPTMLASSRPTRTRAPAPDPLQQRFVDQLVGYLSHFTAPTSHSPSDSGHHHTTVSVAPAASFLDAQLHTTLVAPQYDTSNALGVQGAARDTGLQGEGVGSSPSPGRDAGWRMTKNAGQGSYFSMMAAAGQALNSAQPWADGDSGGCWDGDGRKGGRVDGREAAEAGGAGPLGGWAERWTPQVMAAAADSSPSRGAGSGGGDGSPSKSRKTVGSPASPGTPARPAPAWPLITPPKSQRAGVEPNMPQARDLLSDTRPEQDTACEGEGCPPPLTTWLQGMEGAMHGDAPSLGWRSLHPAGIPNHRAAKAKGEEEEAPGTSAPPHSQVVARLLPATHPHMRLAWLLERPCVDLPPVDLVLDRCLVDGLTQQAQVVEQQLLGCLMSSWGLMAELSALRNLYLLASPAAQAWASRLLLGVIKGQALDTHNEYELEVALQEACADCSAAGAGGGGAEGGQQQGQGQALLPNMDCLGLRLDRARVAEGRARGLRNSTRDSASPSTPPMPLGGLHSVEELEGLEVQYQPSWLMSILGGADALHAYNKALVFLLQINAARMALEWTRTSSWKFWQGQSQLAAQLTTHARQREAADKPNQVIRQRESGLSKLLLQHHQQEAWNQLTIMHTGGGASGSGASGRQQHQQQRQPVVQYAAVQLRPEDELTLQEMVHFVNNLHQYLVDRLLYGAWLKLEQGLDKATSLDEMVRHHQTFMEDLEHQSGKATTGGAPGTWRHIVLGIVKVLDQVIRYCAGQQALMKQLQVLSNSSAQAVANTSAAAKQQVPNKQAQETVLAARQQMADASAGFHHFLGYVRNLASNKATKLGWDSELNNLLTRINFNEWYKEAALSVQQPLDCQA